MKESYIYNAHADFEDHDIDVACSANFPIPEGFRLVSVIHISAVGLRVDVVSPSVVNQTAQQLMDTPTTTPHNYLYVDCTTSGSSTTRYLDVVMLIEKGDGPLTYINKGITIPSPTEPPGGGL